MALHKFSARQPFGLVQLNEPGPAAMRDRVDDERRFPGSTSLAVSLRYDYIKRPLRGFAFDSTTSVRRRPVLVLSALFEACSRDCDVPFP